MNSRAPGDLRHKISYIKWGRLRLISLSILVLGILTLACGSSSTQGSSKETGAGYGRGPAASSQDLGAIKVVTTVSPITSIVENIGGTRILLDGIVPEGVNSHTFAPAPSVAKSIAEADLIVLNGLQLEEPTPLYIAYLVP